MANTKAGTDIKGLKTLTGEDIARLGEELRAVEILDEGGEAMGIVHLRPISTGDMLSLVERDNKNRAGIEMLVAAVVNPDGSAMFNEDQAMKIPIRIFNLLSKAVSEAMGINLDEVQGTAAGNA